MANESSTNSKSARMTAIADEFLARLRDGQQPSVDEYADRNPDLGDELRRHLSILQLAGEEEAKCSNDETVGSVGETRWLPFESEELPAGLGRYQLKELLGHGNMGAVYLAQDMELERTVALKIPQLKDARPRELERFYREARAMATIDNVHVCSVYDVAEVQPDDVAADKLELTGRPYLTMAFVNGRVLSELVAEDNRWSNQEAAELVRKVAIAMHAVHEAGVLHRDIKPGNIMLRSNGEPVVMDFGLARRDIATEPEISVQGQIFGSPAYMSPEQVGGQQLDPTTDVYSLGVLLYELLCGKRPFTGSQMAVLRDVCWVEPPKPRSVSNRIDANLEAICLKAMAKRPRDRFVSAAELASALDDYLQTQQQRVLSSKPNSLLAGWSVVAIAALILALVAWRPWDQPMPAKNQDVATSNPTGAVDQTDQLSAQQQETQKNLAGILRTARRRRTHVGKLPVIASAYESLFDTLEMGPNQLSADAFVTRLAKEPATMQSEYIVALESWLQCRARDEDVPEQWLTRVLSQVNPAFDVLRDLISTSSDDRLPLFEAYAVDEADPRLASIWDLSLRPGEGKLGLDLLTRVHRTHPNEPTVEFAFGSRLLRSGNFQAAIDPLETAAQLDPSPETLCELGVCYVKNKRIADAIAALNDALEEDPDYAVPYKYLGRAYFLQSREKMPKSPRQIANLKKAVENYRKASELDCHNPAELHRFHAFALKSLGFFEEAHQERLEAIRYCREAKNWRSATQLYSSSLEYLTRAHADDVDQRYALVLETHEVSMKAKLFGRPRQQMQRLKQYIKKQPAPNQERLKHLDQLIQANRRAAARQ